MLKPHNSVLQSNNPSQKVEHDGADLGFQQVIRKITGNNERKRMKAVRTKPSW